VRTWRQDKSFKKSKCLVWQYIVLYKKNVNRWLIMPLNTFAFLFINVHWSWIEVTICSMTAVAWLWIVCTRNIQPWHTDVTLSVFDEGHYRNASCVLILISMFWLLSQGRYFWWNNSLRGYHHPVVCDSALTWFIRYLLYWNLQLITNIIIIKPKVLLPQIIDDLSRC
jgi:hypothetical protein